MQAFDLLAWSATLRAISGRCAYFACCCHSALPSAGTWRHCSTWKTSRRSEPRSFALCSAQDGPRCQQRSGSGSRAACTLVAAVVVAGELVPESGRPATGAEDWSSSAFVWRGLNWPVKRFESSGRHFAAADGAADGAGIAEAEAEHSRWRTEQGHHRAEYSSAGQWVLQRWEED